MTEKQLKETAKAMVAPGKGLLAMDESGGTIKKRFDKVGVESTEDTRREYRQLLVSTPGLGEHVAGAILFDETIRQKDDNGKSFVDVLKDNGVMPGIKVDKGAKALAGHPGEKVTEGLDGLRERFEEYAGLGARFSKWRAVIAIGDGLPTTTCIESNAHALARYAALSQEAGIVPVVEPEVLIDGDHSIDRCETVTEATLRALFTQLYEQRVLLEGAILKTSMVISGKEAKNRADHRTVAEYTVRTLHRAVPAALGGVVFLSGGQSDLEATIHLNEVNKLGPHPWPVSFSYARALQGQPMEHWANNRSDVAGAQKLLQHRARCNGLAAKGEYSEAVEKEAA